MAERISAQEILRLPGLRKPMTCQRTYQLGFLWKISFNIDCQKSQDSITFHIVDTPFSRSFIHYRWLSDGLGWIIMVWISIQFPPSFLGRRPRGRLKKILALSASSSSSFYPFQWSLWLPLLILAQGFSPHFGKWRTRVSLKNADWLLELGGFHPERESSREPNKSSIMIPICRYRGVPANWHKGFRYQQTGSAHLP